MAPSHCGTQRKRVRILYAPASRGSRRSRCVEQPAQPRGDRALARMAAQIVDTRVEGRRRAMSFQESAAVTIAASSSRRASRSASEPQAAHQMRAVDQREAFLGGQLDRREAGPPQRLGTVQLLAAVGGAALAAEHDRDVRQAGPGRPRHRPSPGSGRRADVPLEQAEQ